MNLTVPDDADKFDYGIFRWRIEDGRVVVIQTAGSVTRDAVDTWAAMMKDTFENYTPEETIFILQDLSNPNQGITPYASKKATEVYDYIPRDKQAYIATVFPDSLTFHLAIFIGRARRRSHPHVHVPMYTNLDPALMWLREMMNQAGDAP
jgi:hypothetical protein